jgi:hypothetical protein
MKLAASLTVMAVGFVAVVTVPPGPPLLLSMILLAAGALALGNTISRRMVP